MTFISLSVFSLTDKECLNYYRFNDVGLNLILGQKSEENDETNGVGKTAMIESIQYCLGSNLPKSFHNKGTLEEKDIFFVLRVSNEKKIMDLGRTVLNPKNAYVFNLTDLDSSTNLDINFWDIYDDSSYKNFIQTQMYSNFNHSFQLPSFSSVREYLMRNEKSGFTNIIIAQRNPAQSSRILSFLSLIFEFYENEIVEQKNKIKGLKDLLKEIKEIGQDIQKTKAKYQTALDDIENLKQILNDANISKKLQYDENEYYILKSNINRANIEIRKLEYSKQQHKKSLEKLEKNLDKAVELINLHSFYEDMIGYFPESINQNYQEMKDFYEFMLENRGSYIKKQVEQTEEQLKVLYDKRNSLLNKLSENTKLAKNSEFVQDLQEITKQLAERYSEVAEFKYKLDLYSRKKEVEDDIREQLSVLEKMTTVAFDKYQTYQNQIDNITSFFNEIYCKTYNDGFASLQYSFENNTSIRYATGRVKIKCEISEEEAHGRFYMKINMFDISLLLNRVIQKQGLPFLFHDGSYSKPAQNNKEQLLRIVDDYLKQHQYGQYFVTVNVEELSKSFLEEENTKKCIVAKLQRESTNKDRFIGLKY